MYKLKQVLGDFVVKEVSRLEICHEGDYAYFLLEKTNYSTVAALEILSLKLKIPLKNFGFSGNKDKMAITEQKISVYRGKKAFEDLMLNGISLKYIGRGKEPISLGDLEGNKFDIIIRNLSVEEIKKMAKKTAARIIFPNFFGPQRFGKNNHMIGKSIVKKDFGKAIGLILENFGSPESRVRDYMQKNHNDYIGALRLIPLKTRKILVHAYQSFLFNKIARDCINRHKGDKEEDIPIIGFNFDMKSIKNKNLKKTIKKVMEGENITPRDFIIPQVPELTSEGTKRKLFSEAKDFKILGIEDDELNPGTKKMRICFLLPKGSYATVLVCSLLEVSLAP